MSDLIDIVESMKDVMDAMVADSPWLATSNGGRSKRTIIERINGVDVTIVFYYNFCGEVIVESNTCAGNLWELESPDVRRQIEHACDVSLARDGRL